MCVFSKECSELFFTVAMVITNCLASPWVDSWLARDFGQELLTLLLSLRPTPPKPPLPLPLRPRKRFIVQAVSNASEAWFWLAYCTASETLTFLQGLHLELVSCSGWARLGRSLARLCDWTRLSLYGPQDGWKCQTVICQSLADRFKPDHNARMSLWLVQKSVEEASDASAYYQQPI